MGTNKEDFYATRSREPTSKELNLLYLIRSFDLPWCPPSKVSYQMEREMETPALCRNISVYCGAAYAVSGLVLYTHSIHGLYPEFVPSLQCNVMQCSQRFQTKWNRCRGMEDMDTWPVVTGDGGHHSSNLLHSTYITRPLPCNTANRLQILPSSKDRSYFLYSTDDTRLKSISHHPNPPTLSQREGETRNKHVLQVLAQRRPSRYPASLCMFPSPSCDVPDRDSDTCDM